MRKMIFALFAALALLWTAPVSGMDGTVSVNLGGSLVEPSLLAGVEGGVRWGDWGLLGKVDWNPWFNVAGADDLLVDGVLNYGIGGEVLYFNRRCRTAVFTGASTLLFETPLDEVGETGFFVDVISVSLRWPMSDSLFLRLDPGTVHLVAPVLSEIPLVVIEYRHTLSLELEL
jgi:hypothetical protein